VQTEARTSGTRVSPGSTTIVGDAAGHVGLHNAGIILDGDNRSAAHQVSHPGLDSDIDFDVLLDINRPGERRRHDDANHGDQQTLRTRTLGNTCRSARVIASRTDPEARAMTGRFYPRFANRILHALLLL